VEKVAPASKRWLLLSLPILAMTAALALGYLWTSDFWWYLGTGRVVLDLGGAFPAVDPFLDTGGEAVGWVAHSWLWTVIVAALERLAGLEAVVIFHAVVAGAVVALLYTTARTDRLGLTNALAALLFVVAMGTRLTGRAELATWLLLAVFVRLFERGGAWGWRCIALLAALQALWANLHGGYPLGIFVALCYALAPPVEERLRPHLPRRLAPVAERPPLWLPVLLLVAAVADPRLAGERLAPLAFVLGSESVQPLGEAGTLLIVEWRSPFDATLPSSRPLALFLLAAGFGAAGFLARRRLSLARLALYAGMAALAAGAVRHVGGFALAAGMVTLANLSDAIEERRHEPGRGRGARRHGRGGRGSGSRRAPPWLPAAAAAALALVTLAAAAALWSGRRGFDAGQGSRPLFAVGPPHTAPGAAEYLLAHGAAGPLFHDFQLGGYLGPRLHPHHRVFVDPRVLDPALVVRYTRIVDSAAEWRRVEGERGFRTAVLGHYSRTLSSPLGQAIAVDPAWRLVYLDPLAVVFAKEQPHLPVVIRPWSAAPGEGDRLPFPGAVSDAGALGRLRRWILGDEPTRYLVEYLANLGRLGRFDTMLEVADTALAAAPDHPLLLRQRCAAHLAAGDPAAARGDCRRAHALRPDDPQVVALYALVLARAGEPRHAAFLVDEALRRHPGDAALQRVRRQLR
jgi:hypothetical protein